MTTTPTAEDSGPQANLYPIVCDDDVVQFRHRVREAAVAAGLRWVPKEITSRLATRSGFEALTPREVQVLQQLAKGLANKEIADVLKITEYTAKDHLKSIMAKLRVADRTEAATAAIHRGIIHL